jgi:hypothetical protein
VRSAILGHIQQGGAPSPFDRIQATRLAKRCVEYLIEHADVRSSAMIGLQGGRVRFTELATFPELRAAGVERPKEQRWMTLRPMARVMAKPPPPTITTTAATSGKTETARAARPPLTAASRSRPHRTASPTAVNVRASPRPNAPTRTNP